MILDLLLGRKWITKTATGPVVTAPRRKVDQILRIYTEIAINRRGDASTPRKEIYIVKSIKLNWPVHKLSEHPRQSIIHSRAIFLCTKNKSTKTNSVLLTSPMT